MLKGGAAIAHINRQPTLKRTYYRSFLLLVVIPLILVFVCAEVVLRCYDTSRTRVIRTSQQNRQMVLVTAMATDAATDRTGAWKWRAFLKSPKQGISWTPKGMPMPGSHTEPGIVLLWGALHWKGSLFCEIKRFVSRQISLRPAAF